MLWSKELQKKHVKKNLKILSMQEAKDLNILDCMFVKPGERLCSNCNK